MVSRKVLAIGIIIFITVCIVAYYMYGDRSQFYLIYFFAAGIDCEVECVSEFKAWCIDCRDGGWAEEVILPSASVECMKDCAPKKLEFPENGNCKSMNPICTQLFPIARAKTKG